MVAIEEVADMETDTAPSPKPPPSEVLLLDAEDIEKLIPQLKRPTAALQLENFVKKLKNESLAMQKRESSSETMDTDEPVAPVAAPPAPPKPVKLPTGRPAQSPSMMYTNIERFAFDAGGSTDKFVTLYMPLPGIGKIPNKKEQVTCTFDKDGFDLIVKDFNGKNYRVKKSSLEHDIVPEESKRVVKADKIIVKLAKVKGEYGSYDYWTKLSDPKKAEKKKSVGSAKDDPSASIMNLMKDMYDSGDDKMRKMIGETMLKQRNGELNKDDGLGGMGKDLDDL